MTRLAVTMGDPVGIGPEVIVKALTQAPFIGAEVVLYGCEALFCQVAKQSGIQLPEWVSFIDVLPEYDLGAHEWGKPIAQAASLQLLALERAIEAVKEDRADAIVTAPWTKEIFNLIGHPTWGHTEVLAKAWGRESEHVMMLAGPRLRVSLATVHLPLARVSEALTQERLERVMGTTVEDLSRLYGLSEPRIAVCGLTLTLGSMA